jgi:anti-sigma B factor antagonist
MRGESALFFGASEAAVEINLRTEGDITIMNLEGNLVLGPPVSAFRDQLQDLVEAGKKKIIISLKSVAFVDSSGIGAMVGAHTSLEAAGGQCKFSGAQPRVMQALKMTHMEEIFDMHAKESEALASFGAAS